MKRMEAESGWKRKEIARSMQDGNLCTDDGKPKIEDFKEDFAMYYWEKKHDKLIKGIFETLKAQGIVKGEAETEEICGGCCDCESEESQECFEMWYHDRQSMLETMRKNLSADLEAGYDWNGETCKRQREIIDRFHTEFDNTLSKFREMTTEQVEHWCYFDMIKNGTIEV